MVTRATARKVIATYGKAWATQSVPLILSIFTKDARYYERVFAPPFKGHRGIAKYWKEKVVEDQSNIRFKLIGFWVSGNTVFAEWEAWFNSREKVHRHIREAELLVFRGNKIKEIREYWGHEVEKKG
jgi:ketosteroid isomerase-like protein